MPLSAVPRTECRCGAERPSIRDSPLVEFKEGFPLKREKEKRATLKWKRKVNVFVSAGKKSLRLGFPLGTL